MDEYANDVINWLLDGDPAIHWQVLADPEHASAEDIAPERARVEHEGWDGRLLALKDFRGDAPSRTGSRHTGLPPNRRTPP